MYSTSGCNYSELLLSIVIPCYNASPTIKETLDCFLSQSREIYNFEIIIVDDGSGDETADIIEKYSREIPNIKYYRKNNGGVSSARNYGLRKASGKYVWFFDADDLLFDESFNKIIHILEENEPDILRFGSLTVDANNRKKIDQYNNSSRFTFVYSGRYGDYLRNNAISFACWSYVVKKAVLDCSTISFIESLSMHEDVAWGLDLASNGSDLKFVCVNLRVVKYMVRKHSLVNTVNHAANLTHLDATITFANLLTSNHWATDDFMEISLNSYREGIVKKLITKHLSCKLSYHKNKEYSSIIKSYLPVTSEGGKIVSVYRVMCKNIILLSCMQFVYRNVFLRFIKPYMGRN